jgi:hypothetical protein
MIKQWLRNWMGIDKDADFLRTSDTLMRLRMDTIERDTNEHREQIRTLMLARVKEIASTPAVRRYPDFESSQQDALKEFREKN